MFIYTDNQYKPRFSAVYRPAALRFFKAFDVVYRHYWLEYRLIGYQEVNLYNLLTYLAEDNTTFTLRGLESALACTRRTLIHTFDQLENAELLHRFTMAEVHGRPYYIILRTPLLASKSELTAKKKALLAKAGEPIPTTFLDVELERLRKAIEVNAVRQESRKRIVRQCDITTQWDQVLRAFDKNEDEALKFDDIIADLVVHFYSRDGVTLDVFEKALAHECRVKGIRLNPRLKAIAHQQRAFYEWFHSNKAINKHIAPQNMSLYHTAQFYASMMENSGYTFKRIEKQFRSGHTDEEWQSVIAMVKDLQK